MYVHKPLPVANLLEKEEARRANPALMVTTHYGLEKWHKESIRHAVGEYGIGVIFVPLEEDDELPVLRPLDPSSMTSFATLGSTTRQVASGRSLDEEIVLRVDIKATVEDLIKSIVDGAREIMHS